MRYYEALLAVSVLFRSSLALIDQTHPDALTGNLAIDVEDEGEETPYVRSYFYVAGDYVQDDAGEYTLQGQIYVEKLVPATGPRHDTPIVLIHGQGQTGTNFLNKPDGGQGWASLFIRRGYDVYILDQTYRGRSPWSPDSAVPIAPPFSVSLAEKYFTATKQHLLWPQAINHTQFPGAGTKGDAIFDAFYAANVQFNADEIHQQTAVQKAGAALLDRIGKPVILLGHSQGSAMPLLIADARPDLARALILVEPVGPPFQENVFSNPKARAWGLSDVPMVFSPTVQDPTKDLVRETHPPSPSASGLLYPCILQAESPPPRKLVNLADKPILLVTGEASYHAQYDHCSASFLLQAGCSKTEHLNLGEVGVHGNGHFMFLEKNSDDIHALLEEWIAELK